MLGSHPSALSGDISLSRERKPRRDSRLGTSRREFLWRCCQGASAAALTPALLPDFSFGESVATPARPSHLEFHLRPRYREQLPLESVLRKAQAGADQFVTEKYAEELEAVFARWSEDLRQSPQNLRIIESVLSTDFLGVSLRPKESRMVRSGSPLEVRRVRFDDMLGRNAFLAALQTEMRDFTKVLVAEFQVIAISAKEAAGATRLASRIRFDIVGTGDAFHREQRTGNWDLEGDRNSAGEFQLRNWKCEEETRGRAARPVFADITEPALGSNSSYSEQLQHGADYWRTILDGACGIDIYGHNGIAVGDIDGDGFDDLYICQGAGLPNRLYRNRGDGRFEDVTEASGTGLLENTACALFADVNNQGHQDLIVVRTGGPVLYRNDGKGQFRLQPEAFKFANPPQGTFTGGAIADYDRDGWLDIYFCLYLYYQGTGQYKYPSPYYDAENGPPNFLMRNRRDGTFEDVTAQSGLAQNNTRYSFCCGWNDYNGDGWPDLYVVNDFGRKNLYRNNGDGTFTDVAKESGVEDVGAGMSVSWLDYDNDGGQDLYVADMWTAAGLRVAAQANFQKDAPEPVRDLYRKHAMGNSLFRKKGAGFEDASARAGVQMGRWAWSSDAWDFDHDGYADLYVVNGMISGPRGEGTPSADLNSFFWRQVVANSPNEAKPAHNYEQGWTALNELVRSDRTWSGHERNTFYANNRDGTFADVSGAVGLDFLEDGRSFALADFDHDGRQEVFLKNRNAPQVRILRNVVDDLPPAIAFCLTGTKSNRDAIGASVTIRAGSAVQTRSVQAGCGFLSQHSKEVFFGLGDAKGPVKASIRWPSGLVQELPELPAGHRVWVEEGKTPTRIEPFRSTALHQQPGASPSSEEILPTAVGAWLIAPLTAPDFNLVDLNGKDWSLSGLRGRKVLLNWWLSGSPDCQADLKSLHRLSTAREPEAQVLTLNVDDAEDFAKARAQAGQVSFPVLRPSDDVAGAYNLLFRYIFDRHRDLNLPATFLLNESGEIVKIYQGPLNGEKIEADLHGIPGTAQERLSKALPFPGVIDSLEFQRNYLSLGSVFFQRGYMEPAESSFQRALRDDPSSAEALYGLGSVQLKQEKLEEAGKSFEAAIRARSGYPETLPNAWNNLGLLATRENRTNDAIDCFQKALQLSPDYPVALENLGNAYRQEKKWDKARDALQRAVEIAPDDPEANYSLAMVFAQTGDSARAYDYLQTALKLRPDYPEALNNLGVLYLRTQRRDQAVASFEECIRVAPQFDQSYLNLARVYALEGAPAKARGVLLDLLKQHPDHPQAKQMLEQLH